MKQKKLTRTEKASIFEIQRKNMTLKFFELQEESMIGTFVLKLTQIKKTGSIGKLFIPLENVQSKIHFRNKKLFKVFPTFRLLLFDSGVCLP